MASPTALGKFSACANQDGAFGVTFVPATGQSLTGSVLVCQIRESVSSTTVLLTPTVETTMDSSNLVAVFSWTEAQSHSIPSPALMPTTSKDYYVEVDMAFADAPTDFVLRFWATLSVFPGGVA